MKVHVIHRPGGVVTHTDNIHEIEQLQAVCQHDWKLWECKNDKDTYYCWKCQKYKVTRCTFDEDFS